jgi:hypothetical protein
MKRFTTAGVLIASALLLGAIFQMPAAEVFAKSVREAAKHDSMAKGAARYPWGRPSFSCGLSSDSLKM